MEYFQNLFRDLHRFIKDNGTLYMILSEDCDISGIQKMASDHHFIMKEVLRKKKWWEWNYIFEVTPSALPADEGSKGSG